MRKMLLLAAACSTLALVGTAGATKPAAVTISLSRATIVYGGSVKLSGAVSNHKSGESVKVLARAYGESAFSELATVNTASGHWTYTASPTIRTRYEAQWGNALSRVVVVRVRPKIELSLDSRTTRRGTFTVGVHGQRSFQGKWVLVQRLTSNGPIPLKHVKLGAGSAATFTIRLPKRRARVRVVMPTSQTAPGYIAGYSNVWSSS
jgi:hypothetical protein